MDRSEYAESWKAAGQFFRNQLSEVEWTQALESVRHPLGNVLHRTLQSSTNYERLPGGPDGAYRILIYETQFENYPTAVETVSLIQESDGKWRGVGYLIKPKLSE